MTKKLKHELYKHGSYLNSLKESGSSFVNIDDEIQKLEELFQLASKKDHQPAFAVGEYYSFTTYRKDYDADTTFIFKTLETKNSGIRVIEYDCHGKNYEEYVYDIDSDFLNDSMPATAEQIATFKRAEHFASKGRKLDEFRVGDKVMIDNAKIGTIFQIKNGTIDAKISGFRLPIICLEPDGLTLIQTAEELQEVENNE